MGSERVDIKTNSPLQNPPVNYCPQGSERWFQITNGLDAGKTMFYTDFSVGNDKAPEKTILFCMAILSRRIPTGTSATLS